MTKGNAQDYKRDVTAEINARLVKKYADQILRDSLDEETYRRLSKMQVQDVLGPETYIEAQKIIKAKTADGTINDDQMHVIMDAIIKRLEVNKRDTSIDLDHNQCEINALFEHMQDMIAQECVDVNFLYQGFGSYLNMRPLHLAAIAGNIEMMYFLHDKGADICALDARNQHFLHSAFYSFDPIATFAALEMIVDKDPSVQQHIVKQINIDEENILVCCAANPANNMFVLESMLYSNLYDAASRQQAWQLASKIGDTMAVRIFEDYQQLVDRYQDPVEFALITKFNRLEKIFELEVCDQNIYKEGIEHSMICQAREYHSKQFIDAFEDATQECKDVCFMHILSLADTIVTNHLNIGMDVNISQLLLSGIATVISSILPAISNDTFMQQHQIYEENLSLIHLAVYCDMPDLLRNCDARFADSKAQDKQDKPWLNSGQVKPMHYAVQMDNAEMVSLLLTLGANPMVQHDVDDDAIARKISQDNKGNKGQNALHVAVIKGSHNVIDMLLDSKFKDDMINEVDDEGNSPLYYAVMTKYGDPKKGLQKNESIANSLIAKGARKDIVNNKGHHVNDLKNAKKIYLSPTAQEYGNQLRAVISRCNHLLENKQALPELKQQIYDLYVKSGKEHQDSLALLHVAARYGQMYSVNSFMKEGCDVNARSRKNMAVLDYCVLSKNYMLIATVANCYDLTLESMRKAIGTAISNNDKEAVSAVSASPVFYQQLMALDVAEIDGFFKDCTSDIKQSKGNKIGQSIKDELTISRENIKQDKAQIKKQKKQEEQREKKENKQMGMHDVRLMQYQQRAEDIAVINQDIIQRVQEKHSRVVMDKEDEASQALKNERKIEEITRHHMAQEEAQLRAFNSDEKQRQSHERLEMHQQDFTIAADSVLPKQAEAKAAFIAQMNHLFTQVNRDDVEHSMAFIPAAIKRSAKAFIDQGFEFSFGGSAMNVRPGDRIPEDLDIQIVGDIANATQEQLGHLFAYHFGAQPEDLTFFCPSGVMDTVRYKDDERKIDVTLYDSRSISSHHWIDTMECKVTLGRDANNPDELSYQQKPVRGCEQYMKNYVGDDKDDIIDRKAILFNQKAKDLLLLSAFRLTTTAQYRDLNHALYPDNNDLVGQVTRAGHSISTSIVRDVTRRHPEFESRAYQDKLSMVKTYINNFMEAHHMSDGLKDSFLRNMRSLVQDNRNAQIDVHHFICQKDQYGYVNKIFNPVNDALTEMIKDISPAPIVTGVVQSNRYAQLEVGPKL